MTDQTSSAVKFFLALWLLTVGSIVLWHLRDTRPPAWDQSVHLHLASDYKETLFYGRPLVTPWASIYPPLYHLSLIPALSVGEPSEAKAAYMHGFYLLLFFAALVLLSRQIGLSAVEASLAACLFLSFNLCQFLIRQAMMDFPLVAWVTMGMALLARTDGFQRRYASWAWGLWSGLGLFLKPSYPLFFFIPCLVPLLTGSGSKSGRWRIFGEGLLLAALVGLPWYVWQSGNFLSNLAGLAGERGAAEGDPSVTTLAGWMFYPKGLLDYGGYYLTWALGGGVAAFLLRRRWNGSWGLVLGWFVSGYLLLTVMHNKDGRYIMPAIPPLCLFAAAGWMRLSSNVFWRRLLGVGAVVLLVFSMWKAYPPKRENWQHKAIVERIATAHDPRVPLIVASVLSNHERFFARSLRWTARSLGISFGTASVAKDEANFNEFIVWKTGDLGPDSGDIEHRRQKLINAGRRFTGVYDILEKYKLPDGSEAWLYARGLGRPFAIPGINAGALTARIQNALQHWVEGPMQVSIESSPIALRYGFIERFSVTGHNVRLKGVPVQEFQLVAHKLWLNLYTVYDAARPGVMAAESIDVSLRLSAKELEIYLANRIKGVSNLHVAFRQGLCYAEGSWKLIPVRATVALTLSPDNKVLVARLKSVRLGKIPLWTGLFGRLATYKVPLTPVAQFPILLNIRTVSLEDDFLVVS